MRAWEVKLLMVHDLSFSFSAPLFLQERTFGSLFDLSDAPLILAKVFVGWGHEFLTFGIAISEGCAFALNTHPSLRHVVNLVGVLHPGEGVLVDAYLSFGTLH